MKTQKSTFAKALFLLAQPVSLFGIALLALNDLLLRRFWPSWWTGKLSDIAGMLFFPLVLAALLSWVVPGKHPRPHSRRTFVLAFALTGIVFILVKTLAPFNLLATRILADFLGSPPSLRLDASDLLALLALALSAWMSWQAIERGLPPASASARPEGTLFTARGLLLLPLAALFLLADAAAPDMGMQCFSRTDGRIIASAGYSTYSSEDGGLNWQEAPGVQANCQSTATTPVDWREVPGPKDGILYRYRTDAEIQRSTDAGASWQTVRTLTPASEVERLYYAKSRSGSPLFSPGPLDAIADPASGNMLFAMGHEGVLLQKPGGEWVWANSSPYQHIENFPNADAFWQLLLGQMLMAAALALLIYATLALRWTLHWPRLTVVIIAWLGWLIVDIILPPTMMTGYAASMSIFGWLAVAVLVLPLAVEQTVRLFRRAPRQIPLLLALSIGGGLLYFLPYVLWLYGALPAFTWTTAIGLAFAAAFVTAGFLLTRKPRVQTTQL